MSSVAVTSPVMKRLLAVALLVLAGCSSGNKVSPASESLTDMCVRETADLYKKHSLPTTHPESEQPAICDKFLADNNITTKADLEIRLRQGDKALSDLTK